MEKMGTDEMEKTLVVTNLAIIAKEVIDEIETEIEMAAIANLAIAMVETAEVAEVEVIGTITIGTKMDLENLVIVSNFLIIVAADIQITNLATRKILIENLVLLDPTIGSSCFTKFRFFCLIPKKKSFS